MKIACLLLAATFALAGCAGGPVRSAAATPAGQFCMNQVNQERLRGRSAPNWNLYDFCMREHGG